jgi:hypothetical protein
VGCSSANATSSMERRKRFINDRSDRRNKLESIGFVFSFRPPVVERFQALVDFKKVNGRANVGVRSGPLDIVG